MSHPQPNQPLLESIQGLLSQRGYDSKKVRYLEFLEPEHLATTPIPMSIQNVIDFLGEIRKQEKSHDLGVRIWDSIDSYVQQRPPDYIGIVNHLQEIIELRLDPYKWDDKITPTIIAFSDSYHIPHF